MTLKEYNKIRSAVYASAAEIPDVAEALESSGIAFIVECEELPDKHGFLVLTHRTQLNGYTLRNRGFDPAKAETHVRFILHQQTKCADIL